MARNREKTNLTYEIQTTLMGKLAIGESKHKAKADGSYLQHIYSYNTLRTYMRHSNYFAKYCKAEHGCRTLADCRPYVDEWLQTRIDAGMSAYTIKMEACALAKLYGCSSREFIDTPSRSRADITRSRGDREHDKNVSYENHSDLIKFCKSTGLRREELASLRGDKLVYRDGQPYIHVDSGSKGGRERFAPVIGDINTVVRLMESAGSEHVFSRDEIPDKMDIHSFRANYATSLYNSIARPISEIPYDRYFDKKDKSYPYERKYQSQVYHCRGELKGVKLDKSAMYVVTQALGHDRISVVAGHYIRL